MLTFRCAFTLLSAGCLVLCSQQAFRLTVDSIMRGPALVGYEPHTLRWSATGDRVYFQWKLATDPLRSDFDTWVVNRDGSALRRLTREEGRLAPPPESDDLDRLRPLIAYAVDGDLYVYDRTTDRARRITRTTEAETNPHMLRDGKRVSFTRSGNLFLLSLTDGSVVQLTNIQPPGTPVPPEEKKGTESQEYLKREERELLAAVRDRALKREEDEALKKRDNPRKPLRLAPRQSVSSLQLSPDEKVVVAVIRERAEDAKPAMVPNFVTEAGYTEPMSVRTKVGDPEGKDRIAVIRVADGSVQYVETRASSIEMPHWSEDGARAWLTAISENHEEWWLLALDTESAATRIVATVHDEAWVRQVDSIGWMKGDREIYYLSEQDGYSHLYIVSWDGGPPRQLTSGRWEVFSARLSRDRSRFFLESNEQHPGARHLYVMAAEGGARRRITGGRGQYSAVPSPDERTIAAVYSYVNRPPELFIQAMDGSGTPVKVTESPTPEFWSWPWEDPPIVSVPASDGASIPGRLFRPKKAVKAAPAVIFVHGAGYLQNVHLGWSHYYREYMFHHLLAERGYMVLDIDYRGSAGYGRDWRTAIYRQMGGRDLQDHVDAAHWLVGEHGVDPKRIGIYGGSYGGFITLMAMFRHADVFAAGAALRPVTDWAHYNHPYTANILNTPPEDPEAFRRSSPIYFAEGLRGALLMCHGMADVNVHVQDTIRLAERLIELRKENWEMALYPVEDHAFVRPESWADEYKRILKLFDSNLSESRP
jgi:dipeptidyl aminopeptidase/acylaminoacyl peptidase